MKNKTAKIKAKSVPVKTTLNLVIKEKTEFRPARLIPALLLVFLLAALFAKFAVLDRFAALEEAEREFSQDRAYLQELVNSYADYDEVQAEYNRYTYADFDRSIPDRQDVLKLLERRVFPVSGMRQMSISGKSVSLTLTGMTLEEISTLVNKLEAEPLVERITVSTAGYSGRDNDVPTASMVILLVDATTLERGAAR